MESKKTASFRISNPICSNNHARKEKEEKIINETKFQRISGLNGQLNVAAKARRTWTSCKYAQRWSTEINLLFFIWFQFEWHMEIEAVYILFVFFCHELIWKCFQMIHLKFSVQQEQLKIESIHADRMHNKWHLNGMKMNHCSEYQWSGVAKCTNRLRYIKTLITFKMTHRSTYEMCRRTVEREPVFQDQCQHRSRIVE